jgi:alkylation response protein AidB-like acyl-CoA dehydrogenase
MAVSGSTAASCGSNAHRADYMILFCKMADAGQDEVDRHAGATQFLVDLKNSPGIEIRPVINPIGEHHFNQLFLTDLFVPDNRRSARSAMAGARCQANSRSSAADPIASLVLFAADRGGARRRPESGSRNGGGTRAAGRAACQHCGCACRCRLLACCRKASSR